MSTSSRPVIGIYVGTKRTQYAVDTEIVSGRPSYAVFTEEGWKIGVPKRLNPSTIMELNRLIGKMWYDGTIIADMERWPFKVAGMHYLLKSIPLFKIIINYFQSYQETTGRKPSSRLRIPKESRPHTILKLFMP